MGAMARATVSHGESRATIEEGQRVRIGRSTVCDVQVGSGSDGGPEDLGVSRTAATVSMKDGRLWVRNDSASQPVYLVPETGPTRVLENQDEIASLGRRIGDLEDAELELMVERDPLDEQATALAGQRDALAGQAEDLLRRITVAEAEIDAELEAEAAAREAAAAAVPTDLLSEYETLRAKRAGIGVAP